MQRKTSMSIIKLGSAMVNYPTGNPNFSVMQAFPEGIADSDPFLLCDHFGPIPSFGQLTGDRFPLGWHPHRGMDIVTYLLEGIGRHGDSLGNRDTYHSPGMQWISVGSGIEHAEGGGTPAGENEQGFQIWINVPAKNKMDPPAYGTESPEKIPVLTFGTIDASARLLAGRYLDATGPFQTKQDVQMVDYTLGPGAIIEHSVKETHDNCMVFVYQGEGEVSGTPIQLHQVAQLDTSSSNPEQRTFTVRGGSSGIKFLVLAGKRINEPVVSRGPFVMNTYAEIEQVYDECRRGVFPPVRAAWDYKRLLAFPDGHRNKV